MLKIVFLFQINNFVQVSIGKHLLINKNGLYMNMLQQKYVKRTKNIRLKMKLEEQNKISILYLQLLAMQVYTYYFIFDN
jgi:hypothetical protein